MSCCTGSPAPSTSSNRRGFTLVEVLVALAVLTIALSGMMQLFSTGMRAAAGAEARTIAVLLARSRLAAIGIETPLVAGDSEGEWDERFRWTARVSLYEDPGLGEATAAGVPHRVSVTVSWGEVPGGGSVTLTSLALTARPR